MTKYQKTATIKFFNSAPFGHYIIDGTHWFEAGEITRILFPNDQAFGAGFYEKMSPDQIMSVKMKRDIVVTLDQPLKNMRKLLSPAGIRYLIEQSRAEIPRRKRPQAADPERNWEFEMFLGEYLANLPAIELEPEPEPEPEPEVLPAPIATNLVVTRLSVDIEHPIEDRERILPAWNALVRHTFTQGVEVKGLSVQYLESAA